MICYFCDKKIKGKRHKRSVAVCHPEVLFSDVSICNKCNYFPSNNNEPKENLIK